MKAMRQVALFMLALLDLFWQMPAYTVLVTPSNVLQLEFTGGEVDFRGRLSSSRTTLSLIPAYLLAGDASYRLPHHFFQSEQFGSASIQPKLQHHLAPNWRNCRGAPCRRASSSLETG